MQVCLVATQVHQGKGRRLAPCMPNMLAAVSKITSWALSISGAPCGGSSRKRPLCSGSMLAESVKKLFRKEPWAACDKNTMTQY